MSINTRWGKGSRHDDPDLAREHILQATYRVMVTRGLDKTTISEVAKQAKVSRPTIYRYFDSREDIVANLMIKRRDEFFDGMYEATKPYRDDFPRLVEECLCYALSTAHDGKTFDLVSGPNAGKTNPYFSADGISEHWDRLLLEPYKRYREQTGNVVDLASIRGFLGVMILTIRIHPPRSHEVLRNQLQAVMSLGKTVYKR